MCIKWRPHHTNDVGRNFKLVELDRAYILSAKFSNKIPQFENDVLPRSRLLRPFLCTTNIIRRQEHNSKINICMSLELPND